MKKTKKTPRNIGSEVDLETECVACRFDWSRGGEDLTRAWAQNQDRVPGAIDFVDPKGEEAELNTDSWSNAEIVALDKVRLACERDVIAIHKAKRAAAIEE